MKSPFQLPQPSSMRNVMHFTSKGQDIYTHNPQRRTLNETNTHSNVCFHTHKPGRFASKGQDILTHNAQSRTLNTQKKKMRGCLSHTQTPGSINTLSQPTETHFQQNKNSFALPLSHTHTHIYLGSSSGVYSQRKLIRGPSSSTSSTSSLNLPV